MNTDEKKLMKGKGFKCEKCGHYDPLAKKLTINKTHNAVLCGVCNIFAPSEVSEFESYLNEKIDSRILETFRKHTKPGRASSLKQGMISAVKKGKPMTRPAFGYEMIGGELIPAQNSDEVREIFQSFSRGDSLNKISRNHTLSVNGIKKILKNFTYIGKLKFDNQIMQGSHESIIPTELFNEVQNRFERLGKSK